MMTVEALTDQLITDYAEAAFAAGDLGGWNLARSGLSDSPLASRADLFSAIRHRIVERINGTASTDSTSDVRAVLVAALASNGGRP